MVLHPGVAPVPARDAAYDGEPEPRAAGRGAVHETLERLVLVSELEAVASTALGADPLGWDVTIYNPDLDPERIHARRIVLFIGSVIERVSRGDTV